MAAPFLFKNKRMNTTNEPDKYVGNSSNDQHIPEYPLQPTLTPEGQPVETPLAAPNRRAILANPTLEEWVAAGYSAENYPPKGQAPRSTPLMNGTSRFFKKINVNLPLKLNGEKIQWETLDKAIGVARFDPAADTAKIVFLDKLSKAGVGGVVVINEQTYLDLKKNLPWQPSVPRSQQQKLRVWDSRPKKLELQREVAAPDRAIRAAVSPQSPEVAGSVRGAGVTEVENVAGAGNTPATFVPNLRPKSGVLKKPVSGEFRKDHVPLPPQLPP